MSIKGKVRKIIFSLIERRKKLSFLASQKNSFGISVAEVSRSKRLGFTPDEYVIYELDKNNPEDYISEWERQCFRNKAIDYRVLLDNKIVFYFLIKNFAPVNKIFAYKVSGTYIALDDDFIIENVSNAILKNQRLVYKKINSGGGDGFYLIEIRNEKVYINRNECSLNDVQQLIEEDNYLIEEFCEQSEFENNLWPYSVNTIRIITVKNSSGEIIATNAFQRMGLQEGSCVDNACAGGIYCEIDIDSGIFKKACSHSPESLLDANGNKIYYSAHPVSGAQLEGIKVPNWDMLVDNIVELHRKLQFTKIPFIAWDIAMTKNKFKIIEANTSCSVDFLQTFNGARNAPVGNWMKDMGYIK